MAGESIQTVTRTPLLVPAAVRNLTGYTTDRDSTDAEIVTLIADAQVVVTNEIATRIHRECLNGAINGVNTRFALPFRRYRPRVIFDWDASANELNDVLITLETVTPGSQTPTYTTAIVTSIDSLNGIVTLSAAPASTVSRVLFTGFVIRRPIDRDSFALCVKLYAAHLLDQRVRGPGNVPITNPQGATKDPDQQAGGGWLATYMMEVNRLRSPTPTAASVKTGFGPDRLVSECSDETRGCC